MFTEFNTLAAHEKPQALAHLIVSNPQMFNGCSSQREVMQIIRDEGGRFNQNMLPKTRAILHAWFMNGNDNVPPFAKEEPDEAKQRGQDALRNRSIILAEVTNLEPENVQVLNLKAQGVHPMVEGTVERILKFMAENVQLGAERVMLLERTLWSGIASRQKTIKSAAECTVLAANAWSKGNVLLEYPCALESHPDEHDQRYRQQRIAAGVHQGWNAPTAEAVEVAVQFMRTCELPTNYNRGNENSMAVATKWGEL
ncbi:hypothetical protein [Vibrio mediterranei]|uniref:Uncharacterized protein n=1 Tax=Vibrio mediterranei TaxID=689 RepID=A0ABX5DLQ8_9VIBR|nr:hypothetical protein [Vibrio mediterranei]PCD90321.1 hypothetical protein COR52_03460 [Vibrio mediterranei]PRQ69707.1 hypothetical protein COR51_03765 [Vibrio mediterranei]